MDETQLLDQQQQYYRARAREYDRWWMREGRYDHGPDANAGWFAEVAVLERALEDFAPAGDILELACGTGLWTRRLAAHANRLTAVDAAPEVLEVNRERVTSERVRYVEADLFEWTPPRSAFDVCFFSFWLSHVPESRFESFWDKVRVALRPGGRVFMIDSARSETSGARDHAPTSDEEQTAVRRLDDGSKFRIVKRFYAPGSLQRRLAELGWTVQASATGEYFIYASGAPAR
jgi:demethylmenaquinone methyltransferase/2-methoxy-6-polyprenyl-1,4-benzoquinol methylase